MSTKAFARRVFAYIKQVNGDKDLPSAAVRVGLVIADHWNEESGEAHPSLQTIALEGGLGEGTVRRMLPDLIERGHLAVQWGSRGSRHPNHYWPLDKSANGGAIESANGGAIPEKPKAPFSGIKAPSEPKKAPTGALNTVEHTEHSKSAAPPRSSARVDRGSAPSSSADDAPETTADDEPPIQRAPHVALNEQRDDQQLLPSRVASEKNIGRPANGANGAGAHASDADHEFNARMLAGFETITRVWPPERVGDEREVFEAFCDAFPKRGLTRVVITIQRMRLECGDNVPWLAEALKMIALDRAHSTGRQ